jgi:hypothetical protein
VKEIKAAANEIIELLEAFIENLRMLIGVKTLSFSESHLDPEDFLTEIFRLARFLDNR